MAPVLSLSSQILIKVIRVYQLIISSWMKPHCRFQPTCSNFTIEALDRFGIIKGSWLALKRVLKCHSLHPGGYDPLPKKRHNREQ